MEDEAKGRGSGEPDGGMGELRSAGLPEGVVKVPPSACRGASLSRAARAVYTLTDAQRALASRLVSEVSPLLRLSLAPDATAGRGGGAFLQALAEMERLSYGVERGTDLSRAEQVARPLKAARARTPEVAATCDPGQYLGEEREALYRDFERTMVRPISE